MANNKSTTGSEGLRTGAAPGESGTGAKPYVVLARKYRPETFNQLIGQDAMVTTLKNAFATDRIAQGFMLTGVRGVGKTTTARILARALNYSKPGLADRPTVEMDGYGEHCVQIVQSRHPDVIEMDAASNTGVDNIREIIESAHYKPLVARYKVFIIDEVHMLSKGAFNALLKTLEEPPPHVKFIFATTEVRKVPVTVLSRCQRFDLRRVDVPLLVEHFRKIAANENATADEEALALIARAAEGSVRDGLSILDQAISMASGSVTSEAVRAMLGLADRGRIFDLLEHLFRGAAGDAIHALDQLHRDGADPGQILADLADAVHVTTRVKIAGEAAAGEGLSAQEKRRAAALAGRLSLPILSRAWQMLLKGFDEAARAPSSLAAAEMTLIRIAHTADLPSPDEIIRALGDGGGRAAARSTGDARPAPGPQAPLNSAPSTPVADERDLNRGEAPGPRSFLEVVQLAGERRDAKLKVHLEEHVSLIRFEPGRLEIRPLEGAPPTLVNELSEKLGKWTGRRWVVAVSREQGERPLGEVRREREAAALAELKAHPAVRALLEAFPEAEVKDVRPLRRAREDDSAAG
jgi:DNA polymerase III subunit gamma/tau